MPSECFVISIAESFALLSMTGKFVPYGIDS